MLLLITTLAYVGIPFLLVYFIIFVTFLFSVILYMFVLLGFFS